MIPGLTLAVALLSTTVSPSPSSSPQGSPASDVSAESAPTTTVRTVSLQTAYTTSTYGPGNFQLLQLIPRIATVRLGKSILRLTLPRIQSLNHVDGGYGDLQIFYLFDERILQGHVYAGAFVQLPTAAPPLFGTGKWLVGPAAAYVAAFRPGSKVAGVLVQTAFSVAGPRSERNQSIVSILPFATWRIAGPWFLKWPESPWVFDLQRGASFIPLGIGIGRNASLGGTPFLIAISDETALVHANVVNAPKNTIRLYLTFVVRSEL